MNNLLSEERIKKLVKDANKYLKEEASKPLVDVKPMLAVERKLTAEIKKLFDRIDKSGNDDLCQAYDKQIATKQRKLNDVRDQIAKANNKNKPTPKQLNVTRIKTYLKDVRAVLNQEIPAAAEAIRDLTGPIKITQESIPGKKRPAWIATFEPNFLKLLTQIGEKNDYPDSITLEFLYSAKWTNQNEVSVTIVDVPKYEEYAPEILRLSNNDMSIRAIASALKLTWHYVRLGLEFAKTGKRPDWSRKKKTTDKAKHEHNDRPTRSTKCKYKKISADVARLRDDEEYSFPKIKTWLETNKDITVELATISRAYDHAHQDQIENAVDQGKKINRGKYSHLGKETYVKIRKLIKAGLSDIEIAKKLSCGKSTVARERKKMKDE